MGYFARVDYTYADKYLFTGIVRRDGVSRFSQSNRFGTFPSVSLGWRVSQEGFMENTKDWLTDLKLRAGYGETGNSEIPVATNFANLFTTSPYYNNYDLTGANTSENSGYALSQYGNKNTVGSPLIPTTSVSMRLSWMASSLHLSKEVTTRRPTTC